MTGTKKDKKSRSKSQGKVLRDKKMATMAAAGMTYDEIAGEMGLERKAVGRALNSDTVKNLAKEIDRCLETYIEQAIHVVGSHIEMGDYVAAKDLLRAYGAFKQSVEVKHSGIPTMKIIRPDGTQVVFSEGDEE